MYIYIYTYLYISLNLSLSLYIYIYIHTLSRIGIISTSCTVHLTPRQTQDMLLCHRTVIRGCSSALSKCFRAPVPAAWQTLQVHIGMRSRGMTPGPRRDRARDHATGPARIIHVIYIYICLIYNATSRHIQVTNVYHVSLKRLSYLSLYIHTYIQTDRQTDRRTDGRTDIRIMSVLLPEAREVRVELADCLLQLPRRAARLGQTRELAPYRVFSCINIS